jgi:hypothetical protein
VHTALVLVATTWLASSVPAWGEWDGGYEDDADVILCRHRHCCQGDGGGYGYGYGYGYDSSCYDCWGWGGGCYSGCGYYCNPCWVPHPTTCCCPHDNCLDRLRCRWHNKHEPAPPPCWGWDPCTGSPCFQGGGPPYGNCGWGSVLAASQASGWWCPDQCCPQPCCHRAHCLKHLCERWREKHGCHPPCFDPCAGPWGGCPDDAYGGPPVGW